ncbi:uracil-DNA glycosylase [Chitinilyticum litopenaei]|uniref:uracil-DNA glycosylase n=1 Tax=Chitinilyticum litopenaei TaxID=1121276 RepID=UPI0004169E84|nr:uracil-DNA glycosylase [Chitinilyticum litopenaei]
MNARSEKLSALGIGPFWLRRELLAELRTEAAVAQADTPPAQAAPAPETAAPATLAGHGTPVGHGTPIARTAQKLLEQVTRAANPLLQQRHQQTLQQAARTADGAPADERGARIAMLDWQALQDEVAGCRACGLCEQRTQTVFGVGQTRPEVVVVGEAPGAEEDRQGEPFVGAAGQLLDNMLKAVRLSRREQVYIANVLKCRPPGNRNPAPAEVTQCSVFLDRQLTLLQPQVIFAVGRFAISHLLGSDAPVSALRGKVHEWRGIPVIVSYHPAYLLRNLPDKSKAWSDLLLLENTLAQKRG